MNSFLSEDNLKEVYENNVVGVDIINNENVFEEILSEILFRGDSSLLEKLTELTSKYSEVSELDKLKTLFTKVKHKLYLRRVPIPLPMNIRLTNTIVKLSLKLNLLLNADPECSEGFYSTKESLVKYFKEFQNQICTSIKQLLECPSINNRFVYLCSYVASKINIIKKLFKRLIIVNNHDGCLFSHFPWEQIQFILAIFVRRFNKDIPVLILYTAILTKDVIKEHLSNFLKHFETFTIDEEIRVDSTEKKIKDKKSKNDNSINICNGTEKISSASMEYYNQIYYKRLLEDFWSVKNIYSLHLINTHIDMALSVNVNDEHFNILTIERCLLIIGEFTKCSSDSPHLSDDVRNELISLMPLHFQDCVKHLRNNLSHVFETRYQDSSMATFSEYNAKQVQQDLIKIKDNFNFVLNKHKYIVIKRLFVSIRQCVSCDQVLQLFPLQTLNLLCSETDMLALKYNNVTITFIKEKINSINSLVTESSSDEEKCLINELYNVIAGKYPRCLMNDKVFRCLSYHFNYLVSLKGVFGTRYKQLLDILIDSFPSFLNINDYIIRDLSFTLRNLMKTTNSKDIFKMAEDLHSYINFNMKSLKGIRDIRDNYRESKGEKGKPFLVSLTEINNILNCIIYNLNEPLVNFVKEKVNKEVAFYSKITELIETVQCLKKNKYMDSESKIERVRWLIGTDNTELDLTMLKALDNKDFDLCEKSILAKYKKDRKCKYEKLVRDFMKPENNYLEAKVRLITEFLKNIKVNKSKELQYKEYSSTEEVIRSQYLVNIKQLIEQLNEINEKYLDYLGTCYDDSPITIRDYRHVRSCYEMLILKVLEISHRLGGGGNASAVHTLRPDQVLNCGRSLRNYLAHHDVIYDIFTFEVDTVIEGLALEIGSLDPKCIPKLNYFLPREQITFDWAEEEKYFGNEALCIVDLQDRMFKAVASDNLIELKRCLSVGADPRGMDVQNRNALQFAFDNSSTACFEYLVNLLPVIKISRHNTFGVMQHYSGRGCITLDACSPQTLIKLLDLILKFPYFSKLFQINEFPEKEVKRFMNNKFVSCVSFGKNIIDYFHIMVYLNEGNMIKKMCNLGMKRVYDTDANNSSALLWAATLGLTDICQQFINEINVSDYNGCSPLYYALIHEKWETVSFLTTHGAQCSPNLDPIVVGIMSGREVWVREHLHNQGIKPFFNEDGCFNIYTFGYAMSNCDITTGAQLLNYINDLRGNPVTVDFIATKTKALSFNHFSKLVFGFILSGLCFIGNIDIIKIMFDHMKEYFSYEIKDIEIATFKCEDLFNEDPNFDLYYIFRRNSLIHLACHSRGDNKELIKYLINEGANCTEVSGYGETPLELSMQLKNTDLCLYLLKKIDFAASIRNSLLLHLASSNGLLEVCKELIDKGINLEFQSDEKRTSLHYATLNGHSDIVNLILKQNDLNIQNGFKNIVNIKDTHGNTALGIACSCGYFDIVKLLLDCKAIVHCTEWENNVVAAVISGNDKILKVILHQIPVENQSSVINQEMKGNNEFFSKYNDLNKITHASSKGKLGPVLILAVELGHYKIVQTLINCGGDLNCCGISGKTPLHVASFEGHVDLVKAILPYANDIDVGDCDNNSPLFLAMVNNHLNVASLLIDKGADVNRLNNNRDTLLHFAIDFNAHECIKLIEPLTSLIDTNNKSGVNQIMIAALRGNVDVVKSLLKRNVTIDKSARGNPLFIALAFNNTEAAAELLNNFTIDDISHPCLPYLHYAIKLHNHSFLELLLNKGLSPNFKNSCGFAGVHLAAALGCIDCLKVLLRYNSDINLRSDHELFTPLHLATFHNKIDMVSYLLESGAHINSHGENFITPLYLAITMEHLDILKIFIDKGVRLDVRGPRGSMFTYAYISGREDIAEIILRAAATKTDRMCRVSGKVYNKVKGNFGRLSLSMTNISSLSKMNKEKYKDEYYDALKDNRNAYTEYMNGLFSDSSMLVDVPTIYKPYTHLTSSPNIGTTQHDNIINKDASNNGDQYITDPNHNNLITKDDNMSKKLNDIWSLNKSLSRKSYEI